MGPIHVVLDIDDTLCKNTIRDDELSAFYLRNGALLSAYKTHFIFPGAIELLQLLHREQIKFSFFSSGAKERNLTLVPKLLHVALGREAYQQIQKVYPKAIELLQLLFRINIKLSSLSSEEKERNISSVPQLLQVALGCEVYRQIQNDVKILSREDLDESTGSSEQFGLGYGNKKKDVRKAVKNEDLPYALLVDDDYSYTKEGQEKQLLKAPQCNFYVNEFYLKYYDEEGYKKIPCSFRVMDEVKDEKQWIKRFVTDGSHILIMKFSGGYEIGFLDDNSDRYQQRTILEEEHSILIEYLKQFEEKNRENLTKYNFCWIDEEEPLQNIYSLVASFNGRTKSLRHEMNTLCYIAGLLFKGIEVAKKESRPLTDILFRWQFKKEKGKTVYQPRFDVLKTQDHIYRFGLQVLQTVNPNFSFMTPHKYIACTKIPLTEKEKSLLEDFRKKEVKTDNCIVM